MKTKHQILMESIDYKPRKVMRIDDVNAEVVSSIRELHQYKLGLKDGYNKAKETLYTEEQVREAMEFARGYSKMTDTQFIQTLK
jgi:hypothetical protein